MSVPDFPTPIRSDRFPHRVSPSAAAILLLCAAFFWGAGNVANKTVLQDIGPFWAVTLRCLIASLVILPLAWREARREAGWEWLRGAITVSLLFAAALVLQQVAYMTTTVTNASFLVNTAGILTPVLAWLLFGDRPGLRVMIAAPMTLAGAFLMAGAGFTLGAVNPGDIACLGSALMYAAWMVALGRQAVAHPRPFQTSLAQFAVTGVVVLPLALATETISVPAIEGALPELLMLGVFSTAAAFALQTFAQRFVSSATAAVLVSAESVFGAAGAFLILGERTSGIGLAGAALILTGIVIVAGTGGRAAPVPPARPALPDAITAAAQVSAAGAPPSHPLPARSPRPAEAASVS